MRAAPWLLAACGPAWFACSSSVDVPCETPAECRGGQSAEGGAVHEGGAGSPASAAGEPNAWPGGRGGEGATAEGGAETAGAAASAGGAPGDAAAGAGGVGGACEAEPIAVGAIASDELSEVSGMVASVKNPGVYYVHNDSGDSARFFAIDERGRTLAELVLAGATAVDWEDIALGPGPEGEPFVYLGDVGDNAAREGGTPRASIDVYRVAEPKISSDDEPESIEVTDWERLTLTYPDSPHDCEALLLDPRSSELVLVTKENDGRSLVFAASALSDADSTQRLEGVSQLAFGTVEVPGSSLVTGGEISPRGDGLLLRTYTSIFYWTRGSGESIANALARAPQPLPAADEAQGESITFSADGLSYLTVSENEHAEIFRAALSCEL